jgi:hypothetical protein
MEEVGSYIKELGHTYEITESEGMILMRIIPSGKERYDAEIPTISIDTWTEMEIRVSKRPPLYTSMSDQKVKIEEITKSFVEQNILDVMKNWESSPNRFSV